MIQSQEISVEGALAVLPEEILQIIFQMGRPSELRGWMSVSKTWARLIAPLLLTHYYTKRPNPLKEGYLLPGILRWINLPETQPGFSSRIFKCYMSQIFQETTQETLLEFTDRVSQSFKANLIDEKLQPQFDYVDRQNGGHAVRVKFVFDETNLQRFHRLRAQTEGTETSSSDTCFQAQMLWAARRVESFLTSLILFDKRQTTMQRPFPLDKEKKILTHPVWNVGLNYRNGANAN